MTTIQISSHIPYELKYRMCLRKQKLCNKAYALKVLDRMKLRTGDQELEIYPCDFCSYFHAGHPKNAIQKR